MKQGKINVQTENIFPIIKKFLYSDTEIFLRELVSNAVDACQKLKTLSSTGEYKGALDDFKVEVIVDTDKKTLTIRDNGVGMSAEEVDKYINQIAFSGAEEFVQKYKDAKDTNSIIGHFGLGFYSSFMVSDKVQINTKSFRGNDQAVIWESDGTPEYTITESDKTTQGTEIVLHISDESKEYLEEARISTVLNKYCKFLPVNIVFGTKTEQIDNVEGKKDKDGNIEKDSIEVPNVLNNPNPAWIKTPSSLEEQDYKEFYRELYPMSFMDEPLFQIHLNVDYPFNLTGILYFPKLNKSVEVQKNKIQLYSNQVFITDSVENIVPEFLTLLHGVIDSPDIPLNVSRSYLQADSNVKKISNHITKKVADKLASMFKNDRKDFEAKWDDVNVFVHYGMLSEDKFYEKAKTFALYKNTDGEYFTFEEYLEKIKANQTDKDKKTVFLYANNADEQHTFIQSAKDRGYDVLLLDSPLNSHLVGQLEQKNENISFVRVDGDTIDNLISKDEKNPSKLSDDEKEALKPVFEGLVEKEKFSIQVEDMNESENPIVITQAEFMRRMKEQQALGGGNAMFGAMPEMFNLVVNANHALTSKIMAEKDEEKQKDMAKQAIDLAMLSQNMLKGEALSKFIKRSVEILNN